MALPPKRHARSHPANQGQTVTPEPHYDCDGITIYHADCRDVLPTVDPADVGLLLTDPPYGIDYVPVKSTWAKIAGDNEPFDPAPMLEYDRCVLWGANYFADRLPPGGWVIWSKAQDNRWLVASANHRSTAEVAWTNVTDKVLLYNCFWMGSPLYRKSERGTSLHPTQKPVEIMRWIIERWTDPGDLILDPYMGSGPIAAAAYQLGRRYIGIELVQEYCDAAVNRLAQPTLGFTLPVQDGDSRK